MLLRSGMATATGSRTFTRVACHVDSLGRKRSMIDPERRSDLYLQAWVEGCIVGVAATIVAEWLIGIWIHMNP